MAGPQGEREIEADKFFVMPDRNMFGETVLEPNELVTGIVLPTSRNAKSAIYEVKFKQAHDWPIAMAAVALRMNGDDLRKRARRPRRRGADSVALDGGRGRAQGQEDRPGRGMSRRQRRRSPMRSP